MRSLGGADLPFDEIVAPHDRPILVLDGSSVQLVLRTAKYLEYSDAVQLGELSVILTPHGVVSVRFGHATPLGDLDIGSRPNRGGSGSDHRPCSLRSWGK